MKTICLKFPSKVIAHSLLYSEEGEPRYPNIADHNRTGLPVQRVVTDEGEYLTWPEDGSYCADIAGMVEVPEPLKPFIVNPEPANRKHFFSGENV